MPRSLRRSYIGVLAAITLAVPSVVFAGSATAAAPTAAVPGPPPT